MMIGRDLPPTPIADPDLYLPAVLVAAILGVFVPNHLSGREAAAELIIVSLKFVLLVSILAAPLIVVWEDYGSPSFNLNRSVFLIPLFSVVGTSLTFWITAPIAVVSLSLLQYLLKKGELD